MRYDRENEYRNNRRYHQFGAEEDRSMRDNDDHQEWNRSETRNFRRGDDYRSGDGWGSEYRENSRYGAADSSRGRQRDPYPTQNRSGEYHGNDIYREDGRSNGSSREFNRQYIEGETPYYRTRTNNSLFGDFVGEERSARPDNYRSYSGRSDSEHRSMWESVKDFFGVGPKGYSRSDDRIREDVSEALMRDRQVDASQIEVDIKGGVVTLSGSVSDKWMKRQAEDCAESVSGVTEVRNNLEIRRERYTGASLDNSGSMGLGSMNSSAGGSLSSSVGSKPGLNSNLGSRQETKKKDQRRS